MGTIRFKINYQVKEKRKFEKFLNSYQQIIGLELQELEVERYWKIEDQFQASFIVKSGTESDEERVYEVLILANKLADHGNGHLGITGPHDDGSLRFECFLNNDNDGQPLKWAHLELEE